MAFIGNNPSYFELLPAHGGAAPGFRPGQYVSVAVTLPDGARQIRQYSLSSAPERATRRITVKRVDGEGGPDGEVPPGCTRTWAWEMS